MPSHQEHSGQRPTASSPRRTTSSSREPTSPSRPLVPGPRTAPVIPRIGSVSEHLALRAESSSLAATLATWREAQRAAAARESAPVEYPPPPPAGRWAQDVLGSGFEARTLPLYDDDEGTVTATLVRYAPPTPAEDDDGAPDVWDGIGRVLRAVRESLRPGATAVGASVGRQEAAPSSFAVLYVHGWNDYFFQTDLARFWHGLGGAFYALDLRKYGRSLREHQSPGYVEDLETYDEDIDAALGVIAEEHGAGIPLVINAHSTGGLVMALWAHRHAGHAAALVLNSPWLDIQGSQVLRNLSMPVIEHLARLQPTSPLPFIDPGFYTRTLDVTQDGEWVLDERWRFPQSMPVRPGWLRAVLDGHAQVDAGLAIEAPLLVLTSSRSHISPVWSEEMRSADIVLDVELMRRRALHLGRVVTVVRVDGALHDVVLSAPPAREQAYAEMARWSRAYITA